MLFVAFQSVFETVIDRSCLNIAYVDVSHPPGFGEGFRREFYSEGEDVIVWPSAKSSIFADAVVSKLTEVFADALEEPRKIRFMKRSGLLSCNSQLSASSRFAKTRVIRITCLPSRLRIDAFSSIESGRYLRRGGTSITAGVSEVGWEVVFLTFRQPILDTHI